MTTPSSPSVGGRVAGAIAVVTGAAAGIGQSTALLLAREGATVIVTGLDLPGAQQTYDTLAAAGGAGTAVDIGHLRVYHAAQMDADLVRQ